MSIKKHIPNSITSMNLLSGCVASVFAYEGLFFYALLSVLLAAVFDFFDGMSARLLHVSSNIGKELDSLADMISFGFAPSMALFATMKISLPSEYSCVAYMAFLIAVFSALRLAKFNIDVRQTSSFIGLATPANAIFFTSLISIGDPLTPVASYIDRGLFTPILFNPGVWMLFIGIFCYLLVSEIPMFSLKFKNFKWEGNEVRILFLAVSFLLCVFLQFVALPFVILLYLMMSVVSGYKK